MTRHSAVGVNNDLSPCKARITLWATDYKSTRWVNEELGFIVLEPRGLQYRLNHALQDNGSQVILGDVLVVLSREHNGVYGDRSAPVVVHRNLSLAIGAQPAIF